MSRFRRHPDDNTLMIGNFEFSDDLIEPHFGHPIVPHVREWVWAYIEDHSLPDPSQVMTVVADACQAYLYDLTDDDRMALHEKKLSDLSKTLCRSSKHTEWSEMIGTSLLATLNELKGAPRDEKLVFENVLRDVISAAQSKHFHVACDMDEEQEWEPNVDVAETDG
jgi:hypothetical protein